MVTTRRRRTAVRARSHRAGPLRVMSLAVLLLGFLYTHGVSAETTARHISGVSPSHTAVVQIAPDGVTAEAAGRESGAAGHHDGGHGASGHPPQNCLSLQPDHGSDLPAPHLAPDYPTAATPPVGMRDVLGRAAVASAQAPIEGRSSVLRI